MMSDTDRANKVPAMVRDECLWLVAQYNNITRQLAEVTAESQQLRVYADQCQDNLAAERDLLNRMWEASGCEAGTHVVDHIEALKADAERYRWLRGNCVEGRMESPGPNPDFALNCDEPENEWDAAIDAAREGK
jgi:hypothetical protein